MARPTAVLLLALMAGGASACHDTGDVEVLSLAFDGNHALTDAQLASALETRAAGWLPWSRGTAFDRAQFAEDLKRLERAYADSGYPQARVLDSSVKPTQTGVRLRIRVEEGAPILVERVVYSGFDVLGTVERNSLNGHPIRIGQPRNREAAAAARDAAQRLLHDNGYPYGIVTLTEQRGTGPRNVVITLLAKPGPLTHFGPVSITGNVNVDDAVIRRALTFSTGEIYREREVQKSQRQLSRLQVLDAATIDGGTERPNGTPVVPITIAVTEAPAHRSAFRVGFGSEEKIHASAEWTRFNLLGGGKTATLFAQWSSLERGLRASLAVPSLPWGLTLTAGGEAWWDNEPPYDARSTGGRLTLSKPLGTRQALSRSFTQTVAVSFIHEALSYQIAMAPEVVTGSGAQLPALGLNPATGEGHGTLAAVAVDLERRALDKPADPSRGYSMSLRFSHATPALGGTFRYDEALGDARKYVPLDRQHVWAVRVRAGAILADDPARVPFSGRFFLGGSTSLRGWSRYQIGPVDSDGRIVGGRAMLEFATEIRTALTDRVTAVVFLDAGNVWDDLSGVRLYGMRYDAGPGVRFRTPIGTLRMDLGLQLNPISGALAIGQPTSRRWRLSFSVGQAF
jgi:outer membrane protein insertion porin family